MNETPLAPDKSMELIQQMISQTRQRLTFKRGNLFLVWGYLLSVTAIAIFILLKTTDSRAWQWLWSAPIVIGLAITWWQYQFNKPLVRSYSDKIIDQIWGCILVAAILIASRANDQFSSFLPLSLIALMIGIGLFITSKAIQNKYMEFSSCLTLVVSIDQIQHPGIWEIKDTELPVFAALIILSLIGSGYAMNKQVKRDVEKASKKE